MRVYVAALGAKWLLRDHLPLPLIDGYDVKGSVYFELTRVEMLNLVLICSVVLYYHVRLTTILCSPCTFVPLKYFICWALEYSRPPGHPVSLCGRFSAFSPANPSWWTRTCAELWHWDWNETDRSKHFPKSVCHGPQNGRGSWRCSRRWEWHAEWYYVHHRNDRQWPVCVQVGSPTFTNNLNLQNIVCSQHHMETGNQPILF